MHASSEQCAKQTAHNDASIHRFRLPLRGRCVAPDVAFVAPRARQRQQVRLRAQRRRRRDVSLSDARDERTGFESGAVPLRCHHHKLSCGATGARLAQVAAVGLAAHDGGEGVQAGCALNGVRLWRWRARAAMGTTAPLERTRGMREQLVAGVSRWRSARGRRAGMRAAARGSARIGRGAARAWQRGRGKGAGDAPCALACRLCPTPPCASAAAAAASRRSWRRPRRGARTRAPPRAAAAACSCAGGGRKEEPEDARAGHAKKKGSACKNGAATLACPCRGRRARRESASSGPTAHTQAPAHAAAAGGRCARARAARGRWAHAAARARARLAQADRRWCARVP
jgi:hypothetical protein